jgi:hypothetical protein
VVACVAEHAAVLGRPLWVPQPPSLTRFGSLRPFPFAPGRLSVFVWSSLVSRLPCAAAEARCGHAGRRPRAVAHRGTDGLASAPVKSNTTFNTKAVCLVLYVSGGAHMTAPHRRQVCKDVVCGKSRCRWLRHAFYLAHGGFIDRGVEWTRPRGAALRDRAAKCRLPSWGERPVCRLRRQGSEDNFAWKANRGLEAADP